MLAWIFKYLARFHHHACIRKLSGRLLRARELLENKNYLVGENGEARVVELMLAPEFRTDVVFDVGANIGAWSSLVGNISHTVQLHAFEPVAHTFDRLQQACGRQRGITLNHCGLSDQDAELTIYHSPDQNYLATCVAGFVEDFHHIQPGAETIRVITGDNYCARQGVRKIDFLKIDVEGLEHQVLRGFSGLLEARAIRAIQFEYGYVNIKTRFLLCDFYELLRRNGFIVGKIYPSYVDFRPYRYEDEDFQGPNFLAVLESETALIQALGKA